MLVKAGVTRLLETTIGEGTPFSAPRLGVGNGTDAETADDVALAGASQLWKAMDPGYPVVEDNTVTFQATFAEAEAQFEWSEWGVDDGSTLLSRKVETLGTKAAGQWTLTTTLTIA